MAKISNYIGYGLLADRPPAGAPGAVYFASDQGGRGYRDNGGSWDDIGGSSLTIVSAAGDTTLYTGNVLVLMSGVHLVTLPDPALATGLQVLVKSVTGEPFSVHNADDSSADADGQCPWHGISDGTQFWNVDF